ncbi:hypothetical protein ADK76_36960 [Streptomyces griseoflavus]|nr:hypothetical protein ADK76_36960 [Streptomyces griseoflavus]
MSCWQAEVVEKAECVFGHVGEVVGRPGEAQCGAQEAGWVGQVVGAAAVAVVEADDVEAFCCQLMA